MLRKKKSEKHDIQQLRPVTDNTIEKSASLFTRCEDIFTCLYALTPTLFHRWLSIHREWSNPWRHTTCSQIPSVTFTRMPVCPTFVICYYFLISARTFIVFNDSVSAVLLISLLRLFNIYTYSWSRVENKFTIPSIYFIVFRNCDVQYRKAVPSLC